jgi:hypothetical protein
MAAGYTGKLTRLYEIGNDSKVCPAEKDRRVLNFSLKEQQINKAV